MAAIIERLLGKEQVQQVLQMMQGAQFRHGSESAGPLGQNLKIKDNVEIAPGNAGHREISDMVLATMQRNERFKLAAVPRRILPPLFSCYGEGQYYGAHVDSALMGPFPGLRSDLSITIFLAPPESYDGGELIIESEFGEHSYKLPAGDAIVYPTHYLHRVTQVTRGQRLAAVTWIESMVPDPAKRRILVELAELMGWMMQTNADAKSLKKLEKTRLNLLRMWVDT